MNEPASLHAGLRAAARSAMLANRFEPDFPDAVLAEARAAIDPERQPDAGIRDLQGLPWSSIDNDSSVDLDQLETVEPLANGETRVRVAIADVAATVAQGSATDQHARTNAASVYTGIVTFPMLPERLSTDLTSLGEGAERPVVVIEFTVSAAGDLVAHDIYRARVRNHAKLSYSNVGAWLEGHGSLPASATPEIEEQLRLQDRVAALLRADRMRRGALSFETIEAQPVVRADDSIDIALVRKTRASHLIEDFMVEANVVMAEFLDDHGSPSIRRVVRVPDRWNRIVALAATFGETLPAVADARALGEFLARRQSADPARYAELSLSIVKLLGPGQYEMHEPGTPDAGHFGLATHYYTHSTAPNRRYVDLVTQRLLKAVLAGAPPPYSAAELDEIARHATERENAARKVERLVRKESAAASMAAHVGETFDAVVTGVTPGGTYVRLTTPPVEGRVVRGERGLDVADKVRVELLATDVARGFIDFAAV